MNIGIVGLGLIGGSIAKAFKEKQKAQHLAEGMSEKEAIAQAKKDFSAHYATQPVIKFGMFAGFDYAPNE